MSGSAVVPTRGATSSGVGIRSRAESGRARGTNAPAIVGLMLGLAAALVAVRSPVMPSLVNLSALLVGFGIFWAVTSAPRGTLRGLRVTSIDLIFVAYIVGKFLVEFVNSGDLGTPFSLTTLLDVVIAYGALLAARIGCRSEADVWTAARWFVIPAAVVALIAVLQIMQFPGLNQLLVSHVNSGGLEARIDKGWDIRATSTIGHWTALGGYLCGISALVGAQMIRNRSNAVSNTRLGSLLLLVVIAQVATLTFATIALNLCIVFYVLIRIRIRAAVLVVGGIAAVAMWAAVGSLITSRIDKQLGEAEYAARSYDWLPESVGFRLNVWMTESIPAAMQRPTTGWGASTYQWLGTDATSPYLRWISPESEWMRTAVSYGLVVLALQLALLFATFRYLKRAAVRSSARAMGTFLIFYLGILVVSFIHSHLTNRGVPLVLWFAVGIAVAMTEATERFGQRTNESIEIERGSLRAAHVS